jgi:hypothetical protein
MKPVNRGLMSMWRREEARLAAHQTSLANDVIQQARSIPAVVSERVTAKHAALAAQQTLDAGFEFCRGVQARLLSDLAHQATSLEAFAVSTEVCTHTEVKSEGKFSSSLSAFSGDLESIEATDSRLLFGAVALATALGIEEAAAARLTGSAPTPPSVERVKTAVAAHVQVVFLPLAELLRGHIAALEATHG